MKKILVFVVLLPLLVASQVESVTLTKGFRPVIDGRIIQEEWSRAHKLPLLGGEYVSFQVYEDTLYLAVKGMMAGFCSLAIGDSANFRILHSSTNLITAAYEKPDSVWSLKHAFEKPQLNREDYPQNIAGFIRDYRRINMEKYGWYANPVEMGEATDTEYQIPLASLPPNTIYLSVVFYQALAPIQTAILPASLNDGCIDPELISGTAGEHLEFQPGSWVRLIR